MHVPVLYEDNHLLVVHKPAGLPTMGVSAGDDSLIGWAKAYLKRKYAKPGNVYVGIVSRLDKCTEGIVVLARTSKGAERLSRQFAAREVTKVYWALVTGPTAPAAGTCIDHVIKDERHQRMRIAHEGDRGAKRAELSYRTLRELPRARLLEVELFTGRKHQIRLQLAERGLPIIGDRKYGSPVQSDHGIGLLARHLVFRHPVRAEAISITARVPGWWQEWEKV